MHRYEGRKHSGACSLLLFILLITGAALGLYFWLIAGRLPKQVILEADFEQGMVEDVPDEPLARILLGKKPRMRDITEALQRASRDERVKGLVARVGQAGMKPAQAQDLRDAVLAFRAAGKPAIAYAETFGEAGPGNTSYYLATAFDTIYAQPSGDVGLTGLIYEQPFVRGALDKLGLVPRIDGRKEYKSFRYMLTERRYLPPHREAISRVMASRFSQIVGGIAGARGLSEERVRALIDTGPFSGPQAVEAGLIDGLAYRDEVYERIKEKAGAKAEFLSLGEYRKRAGGPHEKGKAIALVHAVGGIERGKSGYRPEFGELVLGSDTVAEALRRAAEDKEVKAILFRIDSPGGSYVASDTIRREVLNAKKAGKPVIASLGNTAASGGYFIAMAADRIVAQPGTLTGSIGVFGGKLVTAGFWKKLGVTWDEVHTSKNADVWTQAKDLTPDQRARFSQWLDRIYEDFTAKVSADRGLSREAVEKLAKGRIWTGEDAKTLGLVDELGGLAKALEAARKAAGLPDDAPVRLKVYPEKKALLAFLSDLGLTGAEEADDVFARALGEARPFAEALGALGLGSRSETLRMREFE